MATLTNPADIARETLKQMMARRMPPLPENYRAIYNEIAGIAENPAEVFIERELKSLLQLLPKENPAQQGLARQIDQAVKNRDWESYRKPLADFIREHSGESSETWGELLADFLRQWEGKQSGLTRAKKRESLDHVLQASGRNSELLFSRLQNLVRSWSMNAEPMDKAGGDLGEADEDTRSTGDEPGAREIVPAARTDAIMPLSRFSASLYALRETMVFTLENLTATLLDDAPESVEQARWLAAVAREALTQEAIQTLLADIKRFAFQVEFVVEDRTELRNGLLRMLQLVIENISELVIDDQWLNGQIGIVRDVVALPMNPRAIDDAERRLKEVIQKQSQLKHSLIDARDMLKQLLAGFVDHLADFADSTSDYHDKMEICVAKIGKADDITQLEDVLGEVIRETRVVQLNAQRSRDDLRAMKDRVEEAERRVGELQAELDRTSQLVRHDQLTSAFNRRGFDEIYEKEIALARRRRHPMSIALLDIDNFKKLNDSLGHDTGDAALVHLVTVIRETLRPQDTLVRYGGEEFVILLPETPLADAAQALIRVQRELTRRYFMANNEKLLITFSAGVTEIRPDDTQASAVKRADEASYSAKSSGKNRVVAV